MWISFLRRLCFWRFWHSKRCGDHILVANKLFKKQNLQRRSHILYIWTRPYIYIYVFIVTKREGAGCAADCCSQFEPAEFYHSNMFCVWTCWVLPRRVFNCVVIFETHKFGYLWLIIYCVLFCSYVYLFYFLNLFVTVAIFVQSNSFDTILLHLNN